MEDLSLQDIYKMKAEGQLFAELQDGREYVLMLYELYPNGTTSAEFVQDIGVAAAVGRVTGLGAPTDNMGWGIWEVSKLQPRDWIVVYEDSDRAINIVRGPFTHEEAVAKLEERLAIESDTDRRWVRIDNHNAELNESDTGGEECYLYLAQISRD